MCLFMRYVIQRSCLPVPKLCQSFLLCACVGMCVSCGCVSYRTMSEVALRADSVYQRACTALSDSHRRSHTRVHSSSARGGSLGAGGWLSSSLMRSVQDFLQDAATKPTPDSPLFAPSLFTSSLSFYPSQRDKGRRRRVTEMSASNLKVLPGFPPLGPNSPLCRGETPS